MIKVAIIDDGVAKKYLCDTPIKSFKIDQYNNFHECESEKEINHATQCALIIKKYFSQVSFTSVKIISNSDFGLTSSDKLIAGIWFAFNNGVRIIHFSLGSIHFQERKKLLSCINFLTAHGAIFISPSSNTNNITFPAVFSSVISVETLDVDHDIIDTNYYIYNNSYNFTNTDFAANSVHQIGDLSDGLLFTKQSNSFAAPVITSYICNIIKENPNLTLLQIKQALMKMAFNYTEGIESSKQYLDWISESIIITKRRFQNYDNLYYFSMKEIITTSVISETLLETLSTKKYYYDTIIVETDENCEEAVREDIEKLIPTNKNIVYISNVKSITINVQYPYYIYTLPLSFNWLTSMPPCSFEIDEPLICINVDKVTMAAPLICLLQQQFENQSYNTLILSDILDTFYVQSDYFPPDYYDSYYEQILYYIGCKDKLGLYDLNLIFLHKPHNTFAKKCDIVLDLDIQDSICCFSINNCSYTMDINDFCNFLTSQFDKEE
ncbi:S8 family serine peptidase [Paenibacillus brasilensis]|uniref:Peptidase S8/S53 domain-containing protein n=1 Tax=Paenibacillus brasilensis TaxID=128574 RepID=A0ABU0L262_9BACL|nr:S8 family serine peptidase [Paenibacillus brasilensis]MDQ0495629.1 hypothetical protein [Paenibacillus brasilensis]